MTVDEPADLSGAESMATLRERLEAKFGADGMGLVR